MNLGAQSAQGDVFLFLHADTRLPKNALEKIEHAMAKPHVVGGGFARRYDSPSWFLRGACALAGVRTSSVAGFWAIRRCSCDGKLSKSLAVLATLIFSKTWIFRAGCVATVALSPYALQ